MAEWLKVLAWKASEGGNVLRGFESYSIRQDMDGWQRGRLHQFRKLETPQGVRGFESYTIRQVNVAHSGR